jgi:D-glycero-D-manno-heptose 1,7-bisphosphate phosphatase
VREGRPFPPQTLAEFEFLPGVIEAVESLRQTGLTIVVVTNQPDVAKGIQQREVVDAMHGHVRQILSVDGIKVCFHVDEDNCTCRKPQPGMLLEAAAEYGLDLRQSVMVGDRWRDIEAGRMAGCKTVLIKSNYDEKQAESPDLIVRSLDEAVQPIIQCKI